MPLLLAFPFIFIVSVNISYKGTSSVLYELLSISYAMVLLVNIYFLLILVPSPTTNYLNYTLVNIEFYFISWNTSFSI
jgi:hypothetical protein